MSESCRHHNHHGHDCWEKEDLARFYTLYNKIDIDKLECLNESKDGSGKTVFKSWNERLDTSKVRSSKTLIHFLSLCLKLTITIT